MDLFYGCCYVVFLEPVCAKGLIYSPTSYMIFILSLKEHNIAILH